MEWLQTLDGKAKAAGKWVSRELGSDAIRNLVSFQAGVRGFFSSTFRAEMVNEMVENAQDGLIVKAELRSLNLLPKVDRLIAQQRVGAALKSHILAGSVGSSYAERMFR